MFYVAEALLAEAGESFRKHSGVHAAFGWRFAQGGELDPKFHRWLLDARDARLADDHGFDSTMTDEDVRTMLDRAAEFLAAASSWLSVRQELVPLRVEAARADSTPSRTMGRSTSVRRSQTRRRGCSPAR